jgi:hypothetical protein
MNRSAVAGWIRVTCYTLAALLLLLLIFNIALNRGLDNRLRKQLSNLTDTEISFESARANIFTLSLELNNVKTSYFRHRNKEHVHSFNIEKVTFAGINPVRWLNGKRISVRKLTVEKGVVEFDNYLFNNKDTVPAAAIFPFKEFSAVNFHLKDASIRMHTANETEMKFKGDMNLYNVRTGNDSNLFAFDELRVQGFDCNLRELVYRLPNSYQDLRVAKVFANSREKTARLDSIKINSPYTKEEYAKKIGHQFDYIEASVHHIEMDGFDVLSALEGKLIATKIILNEPELYAWRDRRLPAKGDRKKLPHELLADIEAEIRIDTLKINGADIAYEERPKEGPNRTGVISILNLDSEAIHIYNRPRQDEDKAMTIVSTASLAGRGILETKFIFPLVKGKNYYVEGAIKNLDLTSLNQSCENLGLIHIESGQLNSLAFNFSFNNIKSEGKVVADYNNLRIDQLKITKEGRIEKDEFKSFVEKAIIIPLNKDQSTPVKQRTGKIEMERDHTRFVWNYMLKSLLTGVRSSFNLGFLLPG